MKTLIRNYIFDASAQTVTFDDYATITLDRVLLVTNVTDGEIVFNFASAAKGGTVATNVLTLTYDTALMADTDRLQIFYQEDDVEHSTWGYAAGSNGTEILTGGKRVLSITAIALGTQGTFTIDGGDTILVPYDSSDKAASSIDIAPRAALIDPEIVFDAGIDSYFIEFVS